MSAHTWPVASSILQLAILSCSSHPRTLWYSNSVTDPCRRKILFRKPAFEYLDLWRPMSARVHTWVMEGMNESFRKSTCRTKNIASLCYRMHKSYKLKNWKSNNRTTLDSHTGNKLGQQLTSIIVVKLFKSEPLGVGSFNTLTRDWIPFPLINACFPLGSSMNFSKALTASSVTIDTGFSCSCCFRTFSRTSTARCSDSWVTAGCPECKYNILRTVSQVIHLIPVYYLKNMQKSACKAFRVQKKDWSTMIYVPPKSWYSAQVTKLNEHCERWERRGYLQCWSFW